MTVEARIAASHTSASISFYTHTRGPIHLTLKEGEPHPLLSLQTTKTLPEGGGYSGQFVLQLLWTHDLSSRFPGEDWLDVLDDDDWIVIEFNTGATFATEWIGSVDGIQKTENVGADGDIVRRYTVHGRDFGKIIDDSIIWFNPWGENANVVGNRMFALMGYKPINGSPDVICKLFVETLLRAQANTPGVVPWVLPPEFGTDFGVGGGSPTSGDLLDTVSGIAPGGLRGEGWDVVSMAADTYSLGQELAGWSNSLINELFFDLRPSNDPRYRRDMRPTMVMREKPFPVLPDARSRFVEVPAGVAATNVADPWSSVATHTLPRSLLRSASTSRSGSGRYNTFILMSTSSPLVVFDQYAESPAIFFNESVKRHGMKKWEQQTRYHGNMTTVLRNAELRRWLYLLTCWHGIDADLLTGTRTFVGAYPEIRIGMRLIIGESDQDPKRETFYITGKQLSWEYPNVPTTTFLLSRGYKGADENLYKLLREFLNGMEAGTRKHFFPIATRKVAPPRTDDGSRK